MDLSVATLEDLLSLAIAGHAGRTHAYSAQFRIAAPFPRLIIDDLLPQPIADALVSTFPIGSPVWTRQPTEDQRNKLTTRDEGLIPPLQRYVLFTTFGTFPRFLEQATGIEALVADTKRVGGGNRRVVFATSEISYHGHPEPLRAPDVLPRRSLSLYYPRFSGK